MGARILRYSHDIGFAICTEVHQIDVVRMLVAVGDAAGVNGYDRESKCHTEGEIT